LAWQPVPNLLSDRPRFDSASEAALGRQIATFIGVGALGIALGLALTRFDVLLIIGGVLGIGSTILILLRPYIGLLLYSAVFVIRLGELYPILATLHLERLIGALTLVSMFLNQHRIHRELRIDDSRQTRLFCLFILVVALSVPFAYWRFRATNGLVEVLRIGGFYLMVAHLVDSHKRLRWFIYTFLALIAYLCVDSLRGYFSGGAFLSQGIDRAVGGTSMSNNPNELGTTLASALPLFLLLALSRTEKWRRGILAALVVCLAIAIVLTGSRASMLGLLAGSIFMWWKTRRRVLTGILGALVLVVGFTNMPNQYKTRYSTIAESHLDASSRSRVVTWMAGLRMLADRPLFGVGIRCYGAANGSYSHGRSWLEAHSLYFQVLGELGLIGAFAFFSFLLEILRLNRRTARSLQGNEWQFERVVLEGVFVGLITLLVSGVFGHSLLRRTWYVFAAIALAVMRLHATQTSTPEALPPTAHARGAQRIAMRTT